jgi:hypothetical protein
MPLEVFVVWLYFWESQTTTKMGDDDDDDDYRAQALQWTLEILGRRRRRRRRLRLRLPLPLPNDDGDDSAIISIMDELWIHCLCHQLPQLQDSEWAKSLAQHAVATAVAAVVGDTNNHNEEYPFPRKEKDGKIVFVPSGPSGESIEAIWTVLVDVGDNDIVKEARQRLETLLLASTTNGRPPQVKEEERLVRAAAANGIVSTAGVGIVVATTTTTLKDRSILARVRALVQGYLQHYVAVVLQQQHQQQLPNNNNNHYWRQKVAFGLLATLMAWRWRRHHRWLTTIAKSIAAVILAPITELIEALVQSQ